MKLSILLVLCLLTSCSTALHTSSGRLISPEAQGDSWDGTLNFGLEQTAAYDLDFTRGRTTDPLIHDSEAGSRGFSAMELGLWKRIDFLLNLGTIDSGYGLKYQFLGDTRREAKKGSYSVALAGALTGSSRSTKDSEFFNDTNENVEKVEFGKSSATYGLLAGLRVMDPLIIYAGTYRISEKVEGKVTTLDRVLDEAEFDFVNAGMLNTIGLIFMPKSNFFVGKLEFSNLVTDWTRTGKRTDNGINFSLGFSWQ